MCMKKIKQILFPLNVLGKDMRTFTFPQVHPPYNNYNYDIVWTGERLEFAWTQYAKTGGTVAVMPMRQEFVNGNESEENVFVRQTIAPSSWADDLHLKCTNVTKLIINGETLI